MPPKKKTKKGKITIQTEMCKACGFCVEHCQTGSIKFAESYNPKGYYPAEFVDDGKCTGCGICALVCPEGIIEVWRE